MNQEKFTLEYQIELNVKHAVYKDCPYFPCHELDEDNFTCIFCYCPYYDRKSKQGGCLSKNGTGEWFNFEKNGEKKKIWDCSKCVYPHIPENAKKIFLSFYVDF